MASGIDGRNLVVGVTGDIPYVWSMSASRESCVLGGRRREGWCCLTAVAPNVVSAAVAEVLVDAETDLVGSGDGSEGKGDCLCGAHLGEKS